MEEFVPRFYQMNPEEDAVLADGSRLRDGMLVLIESHANRMIDPYGEFPKPNTEWMAELRRLNRWCVVKDVSIDPAAKDHDCYSRSVRFIGVYDGGEEIFRIHRVRNAWLVKKATMPRTDGSWAEWMQRASRGLHSPSSLPAHGDRMAVAPVGTDGSTPWEGRPPTRTHLVDVDDEVPPVANPVVGALETLLDIAKAGEEETTAILEERTLEEVFEDIGYGAMKKTEQDALGNTGFWTDFRERMTELNDGEAPPAFENVVSVIGPDGETVGHVTIERDEDTGTQIVNGEFYKVTAADVQKKVVDLLGLRVENQEKN